MATPALRQFLDSTGHTVHNLNTIVVGLSGVETAEISKPNSLDISWAPRDLVTSSRQARQFLHRSTMVFVASGVSSYIETVAKYPGFERPLEWNELSKSDRLTRLNQMLGYPEDFLLLGTLLLIHWRNRIVHPQSTASLSSRQRDVLKNAAEEISRDFKNLDMEVLLTDFKDDNVTLKELSSLVAMSIRVCKRLDESFPVPQTVDALQSWLVALNLDAGLAHARKTAQTDPKKFSAGETFLRTNCSFLVDPYRRLFAKP